MLLKPEIEKTEWGEVTVFLKKKFESEAFIDAGVFKCEVGKKLQLHTHDGGEEYCWVFDGTATFVIGGKDYEVKAGEVIKIPKDVEHTSFPKGNAPFSSFFIVCP
jgi:quercetin dioxygenase-like cupin family protein